MTERSEKAAWRKVLSIAESLPRNSDRIALMELAADMLDQVAQGIHTNPRRVRSNPPLVLWANPGAQVRLQIDEPLSDRAYEVGYRHLEDGKDYKHKFAEGVSIFSAFMDQQKVLLIFRPDGRAVWKDF